MKTFLKKMLGVGVAVGLVSGFTVVQSKVAKAGWEPVKPIELVVMAGKGGGADKLARLIQSIIEKHKLSPKPVTPINKAGGSGAEALVYMKNHRDPDYALMVTLNSFYTTPLRQPRLGVDPLTFAPLARMAEDTFLLWVHKDAGITTVDQFVKKAKAMGNKWIMAGTGKASEDNLLTDYLNAAYGLNMKYIPYKGGGKVAKQLAGKHANSTVNNPSEALGFYEAGTVVPLAAFTDERLPLFKNTPTFKELGKDFAYYMQRSVVGAPGMSKDAQAFYMAMLKKVYNTPEWQSYMKKKSLQGDLLQGDALMAYWKKENERHRQMLIKMGAIKG